jgi:hypothetical protein
MLLDGFEQPPFVDSAEERRLDSVVVRHGGNEVKRSRSARPAV